MSDLTWTRGKKPTTYQFGGGVPRTVNHTTHSTTLTSGDHITVTSIEGSFFVDINGKRAAGHFPYDSLRAAKAATQRREDAQVAAAENV